MFWSSRSQQKKQEKVLVGLTKGDRVILQSGLVGKFVELSDKIAKVEIAPGVKRLPRRGCTTRKEQCSASPTSQPSWLRPQSGCVGSMIQHNRAVYQSRANERIKLG